MQQRITHWFKMPARALLVMILVLLASFASFVLVPHQRAHASTTGGTLIWSDDFSGNSVDTSKWNVHNGAVSFSGNDWLSANNVSVQNNNMTLALYNTPAGGKNYTSAEVDTLGKFAFLYGRVEFRAQLPQGGSGVWPALWAMPNDQSVQNEGNWPPEIDLWDNPGDMTTMVSRNIYGADGNHKAEDDITYRGVTPGYHVFAYDWEPGSITYMIDGNIIQTITDHVPSTPMYLLMDMVIGWGLPPGSTVFPQYFNINYVHVYQNAQNAPVTGNLGSQFFNLNGLGDPGFELQTSGTVSAPWGHEGSAGIDYHNGKAYDGQNDAYVGNAAPNTWSEVNQNMTLLSNKYYSLSCWIRTVGDPWPGGTIGIITPDRSVQYYQGFSAEGNYTQVTVPVFNTGSNIDWKVYIGYGGGYNTWAQIDDCSLAPVPQATNLVQNPGFETGNLTGWNVWVPSGQCTCNAGVESQPASHSGTYNMDEYNATSAFQVSVYQDIPNIANGTYLASAWVEGNGNQQMQVRDQPGGTVLAEVNTGPADYNNWHQISFTVTITGGQADIEFDSNLAANDALRVDDVSFTAS